MAAEGGEVVTDQSENLKWGSKFRLQWPLSAITRYYNLAEDNEKAKKLEKLGKLMSSYLSDAPEDIAQYIADHIEYRLARSISSVDNFAVYQATALSLRDTLIELWNDTVEHFLTTKPKMLFYFSIEYLMGRMLKNVLVNLGLEENYKKAVDMLGFKLEDLTQEEMDSALGNGGLGRLAAEILDCLATLGYPAWGYGIRYHYGLFKQVISNHGDQIETPEFWLKRGNPWEICREDISYVVPLYGNVRILMVDGRLKFILENTIPIIAVAYDTPIPGYSTLNTLNLRLWSSRPSPDVNYASFTSHNYVAELQNRIEAEQISSVLYPDDSTMDGKVLRLKQQFFFASASLQDILKMFKSTYDSSELKNLGDHIAIQINDTHPTIAIPELLRLLIDQEDLGWEEAWDSTVSIFGFTNHTILREALIEWPVDIVRHLLPRHYQIIEEINRRFMIEVENKWPGDSQKKTVLSIITDYNTIRMANLSIVGSHSINGVAELHTSILTNDLFPLFNALYPERFSNKTNGVTPRRWILVANPPLAKLLTETMGSDEWITNLAGLKGIGDLAVDLPFQEKFTRVKMEAKKKLADFIMQQTSIEVNINALFDVQVKRIHEYKRQLLHVLGVMHQYLQIKKMNDLEAYDIVPRVHIFAGKAAPSYYNAKNIIKLINCVAATINNDPQLKNLLQVVFLPNYNVSMSELIVPASDISEHISTAGMEASGTGNMKFAMNGGILVCSYDGANIEIAKEIGEDNLFFFGCDIRQTSNCRSCGDPKPIDVDLYEVIHSIESNRWSSEDVTVRQLLPLFYDIKKGNDYYMVAQDFQAYLRVQKKVDALWKDKFLWNKMAISCMTGMGKFSCDRTVLEYARGIWKIEPERVPHQEHKVMNTKTKSSQ